MWKPGQDTLADELDILRVGFLRVSAVDWDGVELRLAEEVIEEGAENARVAQAQGQSRRRNVKPQNLPHPVQWKDNEVKGGSHESEERERERQSGIFQSLSPSMDVEGYRGKEIVSRSKTLRTYS